MEYKVKKFDIPDIKGLSKKQIDIHLGLYEGYVKHINLLEKEINEPTYSARELRKRIGFELSGVKNHETYFEALVGGKSDPNESFKSKIESQFQSWDNFIKQIKDVSKNTRGIGWVLLKFDSSMKRFLIIWVSEHELGNIPMPTLLAIDMWEHSYMVDYTPKEKGSYVDVYIDNINWNNISKKLEVLLK